MPEPRPLQNDAIRERSLSKKMSKKKGTEKEKETAPLRKGVVVRNTGSSYMVKEEEGTETACRVKGNFRIKGIRTTNPVAVGDHVLIQHASDDADYIVAVEPRRNYIIRRASNLSKESHILAANLDTAYLVASLRDPLTPTTFIDRFLATAEAYDVPAALILNKSDLWDEDDREYGEAVAALYRQIGYPVYIVSAKTGEGLDTLKEGLQGKVSLFAGNSGVGKSSLINALVPGADLKTGRISDAHHTGMHTTTFSEMIDLPGGGGIIDIPGIRGFGTIDFQPAEVSHYFPEIFEHGKNCRYSDCKHIDEPGCAVLPAVEDHLISESRYASYLSIMDEIKDPTKYRKPF